MSARVTTFLRLFVLAGFAVVGYLLLSAGAARADDLPAVPEVTEVVTKTVTGTTGRAEPARAGVKKVAERVRKPVDRPVRAVTKKVRATVEPVTEPVIRKLKPVTEKLKPVTEKLEPVTRELEPVTKTLEPVTKKVERVTAEAKREVEREVERASPPPRRAATPPAPARPETAAPRTSVVPVTAVAERPLCADHAAAHPHRAGTGGTIAPSPPVRQPEPEPTHLGLHSTWATAGADTASPGWAVTAAAWLPPPAPAGTAAADVTHGHGRHLTGAAPPG